MAQGVVESATLENPSFLTRVASWCSKAKTTILEVVSTPKKQDDESQEPDLEDPCTSSSTSSPISTSTSSSKTKSKTLRCECQSSPKKLSDPIAQSFREAEFGMAFITFIGSIAVIMFAVPNKESHPKIVTSIFCLMSCAIVFLFYGYSLRIKFLKMASAFEQIGYACIYTSFFMAVGTRVPPTLIWLPVICFVACILLSICIVLPFRK